MFLVALEVKLSNPRPRVETTGIGENRERKE